MNVFLGFSFFLELGIGKFVIDVIQDVTHCTWPYHLSGRLQMADVMSSIPSFCSNEADGASSLSLVPQIQ